eukprot:14853349-Alexandrium_andersonii.AAC.1
MCNSCRTFEQHASKGCSVGVGIWGSAHRAPEEDLLGLEGCPEEVARARGDLAERALKMATSAGR